MLIDGVNVVSGDKILFKRISIPRFTSIIPFSPILLIDKNIKKSIDKIKKLNYRSVYDKFEPQLGENYGS